MSKTTEEIIENIQDLIQEYEDHGETYHELLENQEKVVRELIEKYKPVYKWIRNEARYIFTHPTLEYKSKSGPILGYQEDGDRLIIYNVKEEAIKVTDIGRKYNDDKVISISSLLKEGHFVTAVEGLQFLEEMFNRYVGDMATSVVRLQDQLDKVE